PDFVMKHQDYDLRNEYEEGIILNKLFLKNGNGIVSKRDTLAYQHNKQDIKKKIVDIYESSLEEIVLKFKDVSWTSRDGKVEFVKENIMTFGVDESLLVECQYRPYDKRWTYYTGVSKGFLGWPVKQIMSHFLTGKNLGIVV